MLLNVDLKYTKTFDISLAVEKYLNIFCYVFVHNFYFFVQIRHKQLYYTVHTPCSASLEFQLMTSRSSTLPEMPSPYALSNHGCCLYFANCVHMQQYFFHTAKVRFGLCCLMTPGLNKGTFSVMYDYTFVNLQLTGSDIRPYIK